MPVAKVGTHSKAIAGLLVAAGMLAAGGMLALRPGDGAAARLDGPKVSRGFVVSWFHMTAYSQDSDCPQGLNLPADRLFARIYRELGKSPAEVAKRVAEFPSGPGIAEAANRGRIDGKPVNVYRYPEAVPDPQIKTVLGGKAFGFDLDNNPSTGGFVEPVTGQPGIDDQLYRAFGCFGTMRGVPPARPTTPSVAWDVIRDHSPAWVMEITGLDDVRNDPDIEIGIYRAYEPVARNAQGESQADLTFRIDPTPRLQNRVHGHIKDGVLESDPFDFTMLGDPYAMVEYEFHEAHLRLTPTEDGGLKGILGGYHPWLPIYTSYALAGAAFEVNLSLDLPGMYYALKKMADADPDPATGQNRQISATYAMELIPAYLRHSDDTAARPLAQATEPAR